MIYHYCWRSSVVAAAPMVPHVFLPHTSLSGKGSVPMYGLVRVDYFVRLVVVSASERDSLGFSHCRKE